MIKYLYLYLFLLIFLFYSLLFIGVFLNVERDTFIERLEVTRNTIIMGHFYILLGIRDLFIN